jgi:hypothetical protein
MIDLSSFAPIFQARSTKYKPLPRNLASRFQAASPDQCRSLGQGRLSFLILSALVSRANLQLIGRIFSVSYHYSITF